MLKAICLNCGALVAPEDEAAHCASHEENQICGDSEQDDSTHCECQLDHDEEELGSNSCACCGRPIE